MTKSEIASTEGISAGYVQQLMMALRLAGITSPSTALSTSRAT